MKPRTASRAPDDVPLQRTRRWLRRHGHQLVFGLTLVSLALLLGWWGVFIHRAVMEEYDFHIASQ